MSKLSEHFAVHEFACKCGTCDGATNPPINPKLVEALEWFRARMGNRPIRINSGYRCPEHNRKIGGVKGSQHTLGNAVDIKLLPGQTPDTMARAATELDAFHGIGLYSTFLHLDVRPGKRSQWDYR